MLLKLVVFVLSGMVPVEMFLCFLCSRAQQVALMKNVFQLKVLRFCATYLRLHVLLG